MKPKAFGPFSAGMNNKAQDYALPRNQNGVQIAVRDALNVDFMNSGHYRLRTGYAVIQAMTGAHSLYNDGTRTLLVRGGVLYRVTGFATYAEGLVKLLTADAGMSYVKHNGEVWCSNGTDFGRLSAANVWSNHALPTPISGSLAATTGALPIGVYTVAVSYAKADGEEGGARLMTIDLAATGGIAVALPPAAGDATHINVYCTVENGGIPLYKTQVAVGTSSVTLAAPATGRQLRTANLSPLPAGKLALFNGRMLSWTGKVLSYSESFNLGLHNPLSNFIPFEADISNVVPAQNGVYVVADKTYWFAGNDIAKPDAIRDVLPYGGINGTAFTDNDKSVYGWFGANGLVIADAQGQAKAIQEENMAIDSAASASVLLRETEGLRHLIVCLQGTPAKSPQSRLSSAVQTYSINLDTGATSRYGNFIFNSLCKAEDGNHYALTSAGLFSLAGKRDGAADIATNVDLGLQDLGSKQIKRLGAAYAGVASDNALRLIVRDETSELTYTARSSSAILQEQRFDTGKGLRANFFNLTLSSQGGAVEVSDFSVTVADSTRRI